MRERRSLEAGDGTTYFQRHLELVGVRNGWKSVGREGGEG